MCGIMAYIGKKEAYPILVNGLKKLEYRGYDSSGIAVMNGSLSLLKKEGKVSALESFAFDKKTEGNIGIGHTRWATHGIPSDLNAHPHQSQSRRYTIVHNGIIENYQALKEMLKGNGFVFQSDTDTEVLVQLIEWHQQSFEIETRAALTRSLELVEGSFAIVLFDLLNPRKLWAARRQSPLVMGIGNTEIYFSSDVMPLSSYINEVVYLDDDTLAEVNDGGEWNFFDFESNEIHPNINHIENGEYHADKGQFDSYMLKEIYEQPVAISRLLERYESLNLKSDFKRIIVTACGTSWHSGLMAKYFIEQYARIPVTVEYASEFRYRNPILSKEDLIIGISQSGETADTIAALELANENQCQTLAMVNVPSSTIDRITDHAIYLQAGPEIGVASTKAFTNQIVAISKLLVDLIGNKNPELINKLQDEWNRLPVSIDQCLKSINIDEVVELLSNSDSALFLGRGSCFPVALEGALKLKEISYIHAEGYAAGEMKHGPIALVDENMPIIALCQNDHHLPKMISNIQEVKARKGKIIIVKDKTIKIAPDLADFTIELDLSMDILAPLLLNIPLQLISYAVASKLGLDVDKPRNLAKSVTVE